MKLSSSNPSFDLIVIGSGPAGQRAAVQAAKLSKKVLIIEKDELGGGCLHYGTIPSKTLREAVLAENNKKQSFLRQVMKRKNLVIKGEVDIIGDQLKRNHVQILSGIASFKNQNDIYVQSGRKSFVFNGKKIIIATGTRPRNPNNIPFKKNFIMDSDTVLNLNKAPKSICILGAGVIGCEYVSIFTQMGTKVTLLDRRTDLLRGIDREIVNVLSNHYKTQGVKMILGAEYSQITHKNNKVSIIINKKKTSFDSLLFCMGRMGNTEDLNLEKAGLCCNDRGLITVNEHYQTQCPDIYAVGDVIGNPALAAAAYEQGRLASLHALQGKTEEFPKLFPYGVYTIPEISSVGADESHLIDHKIPYVVGRAQYKELARGKILGDEYGIVKLLFHKQSRELLGAHIIGTNASELIHIGQLAMHFGAKIDILTGLVFNYPTLAEAYKVACLNAYNQMNH